MRTTLIGTVAACAFAGAVVTLGASAQAERYNSPGFAFGSNEAYLIQHCTYNPCEIDYSDRAMPAGPYNPYRRVEPIVRVYEYPAGYEYYQYEEYPPPPEYYDDDYEE